MKKVLIFLTFLLLPVLCVAQASATFSCNANNGNALVTVNSYCVNSSGTGVIPSGIDTHNVYVIPLGTAGSTTVILQGSQDGLFDDVVTCGTVTIATNTPGTGPSITCSGVYSKVRVKLTARTGFTSINTTYIGTSSATRKAPSGATLYTAALSSATSWTISALTHGLGTHVIGALYDSNGYLTYPNTFKVDGSGNVTITAAVAAAYTVVLTN